MTEQLAKIIDQGKQDKLIEFLKGRSEKERKELVPQIKKLSKYYSDFITTGKNTSVVRGTAEQQDLCLMASFICYSRTDFEKQFFAIRIIDKKILEKILPWYHPDWFNDFVNRFASEEYVFRYLDYDLAIELDKKGLLKPSKELIVRILVPYIYDENRGGPKGQDAYKPEKLLKYPITLKEHIWYLFECDSELHQVNRYRKVVDKKTNEEADWKLLFKNFAASGKIDRKRLLRESLLAGNRNFNKVLSGWFCDLFQQLQPSEAELLELQPQLFSVLNAPHSKSVNTALQSIKEISDHKKFDVTGFADAAPVVFSSNIKSIITIALQLFEKLANKFPEESASICKAAMGAFLLADDDVQTKAAKFIHAYRNDLDNNFAKELSAYDATLRNSARSILKDLMEDVAAHTPAVEMPQVATELTPIPPIDNIDDLIFLASQVIDNNKSCHIDLFAAAVVNLQKEIKDQHIAKLEPALQKPLKMYKTGYRANQGYLDHLAAVFLTDICIHLVRKYPADSKPLQQLFSKYDADDPSDQFFAIDENSSYVAQWKAESTNAAYEIYQQLMLAALEKFRIQDTLPLLSTPTHEPGLLDPAVLIERLAAYKKAGSDPDSVDLQVAISRCILANVDKAIAMAEKKLSGEIANLLLFLFGKHTEPQGPFHYRTAWIAASMSLPERKSYKAFEKLSFYKLPFEFYTGQHQWECVDGDEKKLRVLYPEVINEKLKNSGGEVMSKLFSESLYNFFSILLFNFSIQHTDIRRVMLLAPNNPEPLLAELLRTCLANPQFPWEKQKKAVIAAVQILHEIWNKPGNMSHVFLGACMLASDKTVAGVAAETWLKGITEGKMNNAQLAKAIGTMEKMEFAPVKRFTDLINQRLVRVSPVHNMHLQNLVEGILAELPDKPIKNLKKLLEIHAELLAINKTEVSNPVVAGKLKAWKAI